MNYNAKYVVRLTEEERDELQGVLARGKVAAGFAVGFQPVPQ